MIWMICHAAGAVMPRGRGIPGVRDTDLRAFLKEYLAGMNTVSKVGLYLGALVFVLCPIVTIGVPLPSFLLPQSLLDRYTNRVLGHRFYLIRQAVTVLKMVSGLCWGRDPAVRRELNLEPYPEDPRTWRST